MSKKLLLLPVVPLELSTGLDGLGEVVAAGLPTTTGRRLGVADREGAGVGVVGVGAALALGPATTTYSAGAHPRADTLRGRVVLIWDTQPVSDPEGTVEFAVAPVTAVRRTRVKLALAGRVTARLSGKST